MNREETREAAEVMLHFANGGEVEMEMGLGHWDTNDEPAWAWNYCNYRKAPPKPVKKYVGLYCKQEPYGATTYYTTPAYAGREHLENLGTSFIQIIEVEEPAE